MPQFLSSITIAPFSSASSQALAVNVSGDTNPRLKLDAGGRLTWGTGSSSGDVYLERSASSELTVTGKLSVSDAFKVKTVQIDPSSATLNQVLQYNGTKFVSATVAGLSTPALDDLTDVTITSAEEFQSLQYNGTTWVNSYAPVVTYVRNAEATTLTTGTVVYLFGATGDHADVKRAGNGSDTTSSKTIGLVAANITASNNGPVVTRGYVDGIDLSTGYTSGDVLWLGTNGAFTTTKPTAPDHLVFVGVVVRATSNGIIYVATQNGYELDELHNVSLPSPTAGDFLKYNGSLWVADDIDLGTDTTGNYMIDVSAGTGISVSHTQGEGSTATVTNTGVTSLTGTANEVEVSASSGAVTLSLPAAINANTTGSAAKWTTARTITLGGDLSGSVSVDGSADATLTATISNRVAPIGSMTMWAGTATGGAAPAYTSLPSGWLLCDGSPVPRTGTYAALFAIIGTRYGAGDGSTTFNLPSLTTRVPIGLAASSTPTVPTTIATGVQSADHNHAITSNAGNQSASHSHTITSNSGNVSNGHTHNFQVYYNGGNIQTKTTGDINQNHNHAITSNAGIQSVSHNHVITSNAGNQSANHTHSTDATSVYFIIRFN